MPSKTSFVCLFAIMIAACGLDTGGDSVRAGLPPATSVPSPPRALDSGAPQAPGPTIGAAAQGALEDASVADAGPPEVGAVDASAPPPPPPPPTDGKNGKGDDG